MHGDRIKGLAGILGLLVIVGGVVFLVSQDWGDLLSPRAAVETVLSSADGPANPNDRSLQTFAVRPGDSAASISDRMQAAGLIKNSLAFKLMAESKGVAGDLAAGQYEL